MTTAQRRPSFKERQERDSLPALIEQIEADISHIARPKWRNRNTIVNRRERIAEEAARLKQLESQLASAYRRWEELDQFAE